MLNSEPLVSSQERGVPSGPDKGDAVKEVPSRKKAKEQKKFLPVG